MKSLIYYFDLARNNLSKKKKKKKKKKKMAENLCQNSKEK